MTDFPSYAFGTATIAANGTVVTGTDTIWSGVNARPGDLLKIGTNIVDIVDVTDETHLKIDAWPFDAVTDADYKIVKWSPLRFVGSQALADVSDLLATLNAKGLLWYLDPAYTEPDDAKPPLVTDDGQAILKIDTGALWVMQAGSWTAAGFFKGFNFTSAYDSGTAYKINDVLTSEGNAYIVIAPTTGNAPPNATYYDLLASKGDTGATGATGPASLSPVAAWATGTGYIVGPPASFVSQSGSSYECLIAHTSGTFSTDLAASKWGLVASKGTDGTGIGDVVGPSGATDAAVTGFDGTTGKLVKELTAAEIRTAAGATTVGSALFTATDAAAARTATGVKFGQCTLAKSGSNLVLSPKCGNLLTINGASYPVPTAGISLAPTGLTVGTLYYIYAYMNSGTMTLESSTTGHSTSTTSGNEGVEIKTGDDTRSLVGMARVITGPAWADTDKQRFVRSWFNDFSRICVGSFTSNHNATGAGEVNTEIRNEFLLWAGEKALSSISGFAFHPTVGVDVTTYIAFNNTGGSPEPGFSAFDESTAGYFTPVSVTIGKSGLSEGYNYATLATNVASGTAVYASGSALSSHITM